MAFEETQFAFMSKIHELMRSTEYEKYNKYSGNIVEFKDLKTAKSLGLYDLSPDCRKIYRGLLKDIQALKGEEGKEVNYLDKIHKLLMARRLFLLKEIDDMGEEPIEKSLIDAEDYVIKLANIYMEIFREWAFIVEKYNNLDKINCRRSQLEPDVAKHIARYMPEHLFRMTYYFTN